MLFKFSVIVAGYWNLVTLWHALTGLRIRQTISLHYPGHQWNYSPRSSLQMEYTLGVSWAYAYHKTQSRDTDKYINEKEKETNLPRSLKTHIF